MTERLTVNQEVAGSISAPDAAQHTCKSTHAIFLLIYLKTPLNS
jgi:hypothetical protein